MKVDPQTSSPAEHEDCVGFDKDVIVCENEARMKSVLNVSKVFNEPYVPFKIVFVEGDLATGQDTGGFVHSFSMTPAACFIGDYNNIFSF